MRRFPESIEERRLSDWAAWLQGETMLNRLTSLAELAEMATFIASDRAGAMTAPKSLESARTLKFGTAFVGAATRGMPSL